MGEKLEYKIYIYIYLFFYINKNLKDITYEEAFRIADKDFDGYLSKEDLKKFLT
jgi:hypothetical protein